MTQCPTNLYFVFDNPRETLRSGSVWFTTMVRSSMVLPTSGLFLLTLSQFALPGTPQDKFWDSFFDAALGPCARPFEALQDAHDFHAAYGMPPGGGMHRPGKGVPADPDGRRARYTSAKQGPDGRSTRWRHRWYLSSAWEYWQPGCLSSSTDRFRKFFRIGRDRFEDIYSKAARSGLFHLNPLQPMYAELHPGGPMRHGKAQLDKVPPLCLRMAASFRRLATGECFASLSDEFRIGASTLHKFDKQFLKWFRMTYWEQYVVGKSGVGFDDIASIEREEKVFRQFGLPGFVTCMDGVHFTWELATFDSRWQYKGKEGYPTVVVNVHCTATGRIVYVGPIFPGAHNDKTMVRYDKLVDSMRDDPIFKERQWQTWAPGAGGGNTVLTGCMTLCDSGYHEWQETMNGYKHPTTTSEAAWSCRCLLYSCHLCTSSIAVFKRLVPPVYLLYCCM